VAQIALATVVWGSFLPTHFSSFSDRFPRIQQANSLQTATAQVVTSSELVMHDGRRSPSKLIKVLL
jgi:hypothetical protein